MRRKKRIGLKVSLFATVFFFTVLLCAEAQAVSINWGAAGNAIYSEKGVGVKELANGDMVQLICDKAKDGVNPAGKDGLPSGDDELIHTSCIGHGSFFQGEFSDNVLTNSIGVGDILYVRAWNDSSLADAAHYGDTRQHTPQVWVVDNDLQFTVNATENGSWATTCHRFRAYSKKLLPFGLPITSTVVDASRWDEGMAVLYSGRPNPFSETSSLGFSVMSEGAGAKVDLSIYSVCGTRVRNLFCSQGFEGEEWVAWDGSDDSGRMLCRGVYISRLRIEDGNEVTELAGKLVFAR
jgi:hypothetical protein